MHYLYNRQTKGENFADCTIYQNDVIHQILNKSVRLLC
nr:MAG TPA: hypothetical protein [Caudoviricetes sp.]